MPSSSDQAHTNQHQAGGAYNQDGVLKPRSSGSRRGKGRHKYEPEEEEPNGGTVTNLQSGAL